MKKTLHIVAKVILSLILLLPVLGLTGMLGEPTRELYNTDKAFAFIQMLTEVMFINYIMAVVHIIALIALWTKRELLAALLVLPITVNVVAFHLFLDGGLLTGGAVLGNIMFLINVYLLWIHRSRLQTLFKAS